MSSSTEIGVPFTLASLPRPITSAGRTQASVVFSINGSKKRKRTEVATAVDGEGVLVYSLQNPHLATSYALPPQTTFLTSPYSLYRKGTSKIPTRRYTYAAITESSQNDKPKILSFLEEIQKDGTTETVKASYSPAGRIVHIDSIHVADGTHDVLCVSQGGHVDCLAHNFEKRLWEADLPVLFAGNSKDLEVEFVSSTTAKAAVRGLLRNREDIATLLDPPQAQAHDIAELTPVLCVIFRRSDHQRLFTLFQIQPRSPDLITALASPIKHLLTWELTLPGPQSTPTEARQQYYLHASTGILHQLSDNCMISYDLSGTVPRSYSHVEPSNFGIESFLRISPDLLFTVSTKSFGILDVKYSSIQAQLPFSPQTTTGDEAKKRKAAEIDIPDGQDSVPALIHYFSDLNLAVVLSEQEILGIPLDSSVTRKRTKTVGSLLINSIGKGFAEKKPVADEGEGSQLSKLTQKLDRYASKGRVADFENALASHLGIELVSSNSLNEDLDSSSNAEIPNGHDASASTNGTSDEAATMEGGQQEASEKDPQRWKLPTKNSNPTQYRQLALFTLGQIFQLARSDSPSSKALGHRSIQITFFPPNAFQWLLSLGYITKESIRRAILTHSTLPLETNLSISDGDIVKAIIELDPELHVLSAVLGQRHFLPIGEVVQAIQVLIQSLDSQPKINTHPRLLTNGAGEDGNDMDVDLASELDSATHDLDHALSLLNDGLHIRSQTLRSALVRLHTFPTTVITSGLRSILPRGKLESLIRILHSELRNGGWTSLYEFSDSDLQSTSEGPENQAVAIIASLLSCALDAIGTSAWLGTRGAIIDSTEDMIDDLLHDTAEALSGFWEGRFMTGLLNEFLRYAHKLPHTNKPSNERLQEQGKPIVVKNTIDGELPMLPLGSKPDLGIDNKKPGNRKGTRSAREMGLLISKKVPRYSSEKIVMY
ncbi:hypothetical protein B0J11DRAFT_541359 [Dendryphion nanum]|uniref:Utp8 beta-propeller domain-containing protein n=1 Tax=Dendryphion nanum TaxID=256645 RepID=A0A9P9D7K7_9PLEO|nr:hypothetical protein B0J11DRAFT_541359 [Dendryphion nanum]